MLLQFVELEIIFWIELIKYILAYKISARKSIKNKKNLFLISGFISITLNLALLNVMQMVDVYICLMFLAIGLVFVFMKDRFTEKIWKIIIIFLSVTSIDYIMDKLTCNISFVSKMTEEIKIIVWDTTEVVFLGLLLFFSNVLQRKNFGKKNDISKKLVQASVIYADICLCLCSTYMFRNTTGDKFYSIFCLVSFFGVFFLGNQMIKIFDYNNALKNAVEQKNQMNEMQKAFYQNIINNEEEIRKYRHDMNNHFMIITNYLQNNKTDEAKEYIDKINQVFLATSRKKYATGNEVIDAISGYYISLVDSFVDVKVEGTLHDEIDIEDINLCTIYSNLLKNAVEELQKLNDNGEKDLKLNICFEMGRAFFHFCIVNSAFTDNKFAGIKTPTSKKDKKNHGIGLGNVMTALDKEHGKLVLSDEKGSVCADVIIPINKTNKWAG